EMELLTVIMMEESPVSIFNGIFDETLKQLNSREKQFLIEKFVWEKTDDEIGDLFGISRQGVTNRKHRLYKKVRKCLNDNNI
ncbi:hypothetical protein FJR50_14970, partial [Listeria monocytogenes]|nr:hypothetical protein [Listeria monocytogenes]